MSVDFSYLGYVNPFYQSGLGRMYNDTQVMISRYNSVYNDEQVNSVNKAIDTALSTMSMNDKTDREKVKLVHDYIAKNAKYDYDFEDASYRAYGLFDNKKAVCNGYADATAIFLDRIGIPNLEVNSEDHKWNLVYVDNKWSHLDVTWDDHDETIYGSYITYDYFLIDTNTLLSLDNLHHNFDRTKFLEAS